jgi:hypothetical protein
MWFYIPAAIVIALLAFWVARTKLFRHRMRHNADPGYEGTYRGTGDVGLYHGGGNGGGGT